MPKRVLAVAGGLAIAAGLVVGLVAVTDYVITSSADRRFRITFREIQFGMPEVRVIELLGNPDQRSAEFFLGQRAGFEAAYQRAAASNSAYFLVWRREADLVYSVGINSERRVTVAEVGGT